MKKHIITILLVILALTAITVTATSTAEIKYEVDKEGTTLDTVVSDVPFKVNVMMKVSFTPTVSVSNNNVNSLKLHTAGTGFTDVSPIFLEGIRGSWLPQAGNPDQNRLFAPNTWQYLFTAGSGTVDTTKDEWKKVMTLRTKVISDGTISLYLNPPSVTNEIGGNNELFTIGITTPLTVAPQLSVCGDGVVGYIDGNTAGIKDGNDVNEACDDRNFAGSSSTNNYAVLRDGCSSDCKVVDLGYSCTNTAFGNRASVCTVIPAKELLVQKLTALINGDCYPQTTPACTHPAALYKSDVSINSRITYDEGKLDSSEKIYMIAQIGVALREFFSQTVQS